MSMPDFLTWAQNIITRARPFGTAQDEIERALEQAFLQGYHLRNQEIERSENKRSV